MNQYTQETCPGGGQGGTGGPGNLFGDPGKLTSHKEEPIFAKISIFSPKNDPGNHLICPGNVPGGPGNVS